jgi:hypothetical protein
MTAIISLNPFSAILLFGRKKKTPSIAPTSPPEKPEHKPQLKGTIVGKYEFAEGKLKFYAIKGVFKKRWVAINEFPAAEITNVDSIGNGLIITWNGATHCFLHQKKSESFNGLRDQILGLLAEQQQAMEKNQKQSELKANLKAALNATLDTVDLTFNILIGLHEKRVNWQSLKAYSDRLVCGVSWTGQTLPPLNVDLSKISDAIIKQVPKDVSREVLGVLKAIYAYFYSLPNKEDTTENLELMKNAKNAMTIYLILNDVMFARVTGQKDDPKELAALENAVSILIDPANIEINLDDIASSIQKTSAPDSKIDVDDFRENFREQIATL